VALRSFNSPEDQSDSADPAQSHGLRKLQHARSCLFPRVAVLCAISTADLAESADSHAQPSSGIDRKHPELTPNTALSGIWQKAARAAAQRASPSARRPPSLRASGPGTP
jgi:hypothetical protein